jgi:hypothetical protein
MLDEVNNPFSLQRSTKYDLLNPYDQAKQLVSDSQMKLPDFYNTEGQLSQGALRAYAERRARAQVNALPENIERAMVWGAPKEGYPEVKSIEDLQMIKGLDQDLKDSFVDRYVDELTNNYMDLVAQQLKTKGKDGKDLLKLLPYESSRAAVPGVGDIEGVDFQAFAKPLSGTLKSAVGFGVDPMGRYLVEEVVEREVRSGRTKQKKKESVIREANPSEIAQITNALSKDYGLTISEKSVSSQEDPLGIR